jgi:hypothetical protein
MVCPAPNCNAPFVGAKLREHLGECRNLSSLQCEVCEQEFKNPMSKCRHKKKGGCVPPPSPSKVWVGGARLGDVVVTNSRNTNIEQHINLSIDNSVTTTNNYHVVVAPNSFGHEDIDVVKDFLARNPEIIKFAESEGAVDSTLWLTTHKQFPENDNLVGMYQNGGDVQVKVDGVVRHVWTQKVFNKMIENNNRLIASREIEGLTSANVWRSLGARSKKDLEKKRQRLAKELLVNKMQSDLAADRNPLEFVPRQQNFPLVVDFSASVDKFYKTFVEFGKVPELARYVDICTPFCVSAGLYYRTRWWEVGTSILNGEEISVFRISTKGKVFEVLRNRIRQFKELMLYDHCRKSDAIAEGLVDQLDVDSVAHGVLENL